MELGSTWVQFSEGSLKEDGIGCFLSSVRAHSQCAGPVSEEPTMLQARNTPAVCWKLPRCFMR